MLKILKTKKHTLDEIAKKYNALIIPTNQYLENNLYVKNIKHNNVLIFNEKNNYPLNHVIDPFDLIKQYNNFFIKLKNMVLEGINYNFFMIHLKEIYFINCYYVNNNNKNNIACICVNQL